MPERFPTVAARFVFADLPERSLTLTSRDRQGANLPKRSLTVAARFVLADLPERFLTVAARFVLADLPERSLPGKSIAVELPFEINTANMGAFESGESFPWKDIPMRKASSCP